MIVVCYGLPGTGKTTIGRRLAEELNCPSLGTDTVRRRVLPNPTYTFEERQLIYRTLFYIIELLHQHGIHVVVDGTFTRNELRSEIVATAKRIGTPVIFVECRCDRDTAIRRIQTRQDTESDAKAETYDRLFERWEENESPHLLVDTTRPLEETVDFVLKHLEDPRTFRLKLMS